MTPRHCVYILNLPFPLSPTGKKSTIMKVFRLTLFAPVASTLLLKTLLLTVCARHGAAKLDVNGGMQMQDVVKGSRRTLLDRQEVRREQRAGLGGGRNRAGLAGAAPTELELARIKLRRRESRQARQLKRQQGEVQGSVAVDHDRNGSAAIATNAAPWSSTSFIFQYGKPVEHHRPSV